MIGTHVLKKHLETAANTTVLYKQNMKLQSPYIFMKYSCHLSHHIFRHALLHFTDYKNDSGFAWRRIFFLEVMRELKLEGRKKTACNERLI